MVATTITLNTMFIKAMMDIMAIIVRKVRNRHQEIKKRPLDVR